MDAVIIHLLQTAASGLEIDSVAVGDWLNTADGDAMKKHLTFPETYIIGATAKKYPVDLHKPKKDEVRRPTQHGYASHSGHTFNLMTVVNALVSAGGRVKVCSGSA